ncbi:MAG TPA: DUF2721 domain-containing protein [Terriglobales bacterium]|nr:DUF2721 domain-containing protein [Terriglobales bacterium]
MNPVDEIAHVIQISIAPVFVLTGVGTLLNVLAGRLARIVDRARQLEQRLKLPEASSQAETLKEFQIVQQRGRLIYLAITLSTVAALTVCILIASLFASAILHYSTRIIVCGLFIFAMLAYTLSLMFFLREIFLALQTFEIVLQRMTPQSATDHRMHVVQAQK